MDVDQSLYSDSRDVTIGLHPIYWASFLKKKEYISQIEAYVFQHMKINVIWYYV